MMALAYGVWPHEWLTFANSYLNWGKDTFVVRENQLFGGSFPPIDVPRYVLADIVAAGSYFVFGTINVYLFAAWQKRKVAEPVAAVEGEARRPTANSRGPFSAAAPPSRRSLRVRPSRHEASERIVMAKTDANPPMPEFSTSYVLQEVDPAWLTSAVKPKQFLHIDQAECILCEGCVDICPWKCIHMLSTGAIDEAVNADQPGDDPKDHVVFVVDEDVCTRCALCVDRCPTGVIILGKVTNDWADGDPNVRTNRHGYAYGVRF